VGNQGNKERNKKILESNKNENTTYCKLWESKQAALRGKFTAMSTYIKKKFKTKQKTQRDRK
jgi:hypothetical protein